jgi:predicted nucleic acid-binding Zn ribbon protein
MPTYVYKFIETGETIEVQQSFDDPTLTEVVHPDRGEVMAVKKVFLPVGVTFKGDGFYKTDSRSAKQGATKGDSTAGSGDSGTASTSSSTSSSTGSSTGSSNTASTASPTSSSSGSSSGGSSGSSRPAASGD